jgi:2-polyprenyl-3-methyl-5-hydroxy-6-metoxy-1,4-benzoquinol methylase
MNPRPDADELKTIYDTYHQRNGKDEGDWEVMMWHNFREVSSMLARKYPSAGRLLDIGCGYGHFLHIMERLHWRAEGIDPSSHTVHQAGKAGRIVTNATIDDAVIPECSFNAVTMFYVLEHVTDPLKTLRKVFSLLVPGSSENPQKGFQPAGSRRIGRYQDSSYDAACPSPLCFKYKK